MTNKDVNKLYESYAEDLRSYLNWALSNLNKYKNELIDIGFVIYLELYAKLFKLSKSHGKNYLLEFKNVFDKKFDNYIQKLLQYKFLDQLDELFLINIGYNKSNKYIIVITKNSKRVLLNWLSIYYNNIINVILLEKVEFIDSEMFNHNSFNLFKRYFILKYNINPDNINKYYNQPFLGLIVKDTNYLLGDGEYVYSDQNKKEEITYGLPHELLFSTGREFVTNEYTYSITNELCKLEEYNKLIPLPKIGTLMNDSLRSLYYIQNCNRIVPSNFNKKVNRVNSVSSANNTAETGNSVADGDNGNASNLSNVTFNEQNDTQSDLTNNTGNAVDDENRIESDVVYILSYGISNNNQMNCCTLSSFDGKYIAIGQNNGIILLYDLLTSECNNVYNDISCIIGSGIAYKSVSTLNPAFTKSNSNSNSNYNSTSNNYAEEQQDYNYSARDEDENSNIIYGHDGVVNCVKFGENGQVLLSAGNDGLIKLYTTNNNSCKAIYYNTANTPNSNSTVVGGVNSVLRLDYGNYGYYFSSCDVNGYCKLWCTDRSFPLRNYKPVNNSFYYNRFHPNSSLITLLSYNDIFTIYDLKTNKLALQFCYNTLNFDEFRTILNGNTNSNTNSNSNSKSNLSNVKSNLGKNKKRGKNVCGSVDGRGRINWSKNGMIYGISKENVILLYDVRNGKLLEKIVHNSHILDFDFSYSTNIISVIDQNNMSFWAFNNMNKYILNYQVSEEEDLEPVKLKKNLLKAYKFNDMNLVHNAYTPENVLLSLGISTL